MERIKQAIEKIKDQESRGRSGVNTMRPASPEAEYTQRSTQAHDNLENIDYTNTRVNKLSMDLLDKYRIVALNKNDPKSLVFDLLRTRVLQKMEENNWHTIGITSPTPESGKTVVAINLAMSIAQQTNKTALLVDFDFRRPKIGEYLGLSMEKSLNDLIDGTAILSEVLVNPGMPRLVVLPTKKPVKKSSETLSSKFIADLINDFRERYGSRIVIFDMPPILGIDDALALLPRIDCMLMVVANGMSSKREIEDSLHQIPKEKLVGAILNKAEIESVAYYY